MDLPHRGKITGMGIRKGITLIVGGGYHGKSTLLKALELGVYDHIAGRRQGICDHGQYGHEDPGGGRAEHPEDGYLYVHQ